MIQSHNNSPPTSNDDTIISTVVIHRHRVLHFFLDVSSPSAPRHPYSTQPNPSIAIISRSLSFHPVNYSNSFPSRVLRQENKDSGRDWLNTIFDVFQIAKNYSCHYAMHSTTMKFLQSATSFSPRRQLVSQTTKGKGGDRTV